MNKNTQVKENNKSDKGQVIEMKQHNETNEQDVKIEMVKSEANVKINEQRTALELKIQELKTENEKSMKETEQKYQAKMKFWDNMTDAIKTTVVTAGAVTAIGILSSADSECKMEELRTRRYED